MNTETVVITGAGTGIGKALAHHFADMGFKVLGTGRRLEPLQEMAAYNPALISIVQSDVSTDPGRVAIAKALTDSKVRYLIQNAAILGPVLPLAQMDEEGWRQHMAINVDGPLFLTKKLRPLMFKGTRILHISSGAAHNAYKGWGAYCTSKAALHMIYRSLDLELKEEGIRVGSMRPGVVDTPMQDNVRSSSSDYFPDLPFFIELKNSGGLIPPEQTARFAFNLLTTTDDDSFAGREWDIREQQS